MEKKCLNCGSTNLKEGYLVDYTGVKFGLGTRGLWVKGSLPVDGNMCLECGHIGLYAKLDEFNKFKSKNQQLVP